jgi:hypothetical protein
VPIRHRFNSTVPDGGDTSLVRPSNWNDTHVFPWRAVTAGETLNASDPVAASIATAQTFPLPVTIVAGDVFELRNNSDSTALASIDPGAGRQIQGCPVADTLTIDAGDTATLVARTSTFFELVTPGAVGPPGPAPDAVEPPGFDSVQEWRTANNTSSWQILGAETPTVTGAARARVIATTNAALARANIGADVTVASTTATAGWRIGRGHCFIGSGAAGGFSLAGGFLIYDGATNSSHRSFSGVRGDISAPTDVNPSTLVNILGFGYDAADTNVHFFHNDGSGTATKVNTGIAKPTANAVQGFVYKIECQPGGPVNFYIKELVSGAEFSGVASTDLPAATQLLNWLGYASVGGVSAVIGIAFYSHGLTIRS